MSVTMSLGIKFVHLPLSITGTMASTRAKWKTLFKAHLGMYLIKCLWTCLPKKTSSYSWTRISIWMETTSQQETPSIVAKGITPAQNGCKRKVIDNREVEHSCKLKQIHLCWKQLWRLRLWGDSMTWRSHKGREINREGVACAEATTQGRTWPAHTREWVTIGIGTTRGTVCTDRWNCTYTSYRSIPTTNTKQTKWAVLLITCKRIREHACCCAHTCYPNHLAQSPRRRQEESLTGTVRIFLQVDAHIH